MTGRRTSSPSTVLWTATITLLLFSVSVRSQSALALNEAAPSPLAAATDSPSGSVDASLRKVDSIVKSPSATSKSGSESPEASLDAVVLGEKIAAGNSTSNKLDDPKEQNEPAVKSGKLEKLQEIARVDEKSGAAGISLPEFSEKEDYVDTHELEEENDREPTTPHTKKTNNESPEEPKKKEVEPNAGNSGERDVKDIEKTKPEVGISLANDTNVNYNKKTVKPSKEDGTLENDSKGLKSALENATNVIASGEAADTQLEKDKGPKDQVEVVKNSTLPKVQRIAVSSERTGDERKEVENPGSAERDDNTGVPTTATPNSKDLGQQKGKTDGLTVSGSEVEAEKVEANGTLPIPKGRTISFGGTNEFVTGHNKTGDDGAANDQGIGVDITKETLQEHTNTEFKPYPYVKTTANYPSNGSDAQLPLPKDREVPESTEEASALENTIGQRQQDKKFVVTEPSLVIDNSIQQFKPTYFKRSGNVSRIQTSLVTGSSTTVSSLEGDQSGLSMASTESAASENNTTAYIDSLRISNAENDVPRGKDEETKTSVGVKDTSAGLDLNGNGITEVVGGTKNNTISMIDDFGFTKTPIASTASTARATEDSQVQNSTEQIAITSDDVITTMDVQTDSGNSMLKISTLNVTEGSTRIPSTESATSVETSTATLPTTSSMPKSSFSTTGLEDLTTVAPEESTNVVPQETLRPEESSTTDGSVDSTTSKVEYEFVGLTESTVSQRYIASSESSNDLTDEREVVSSSSSSPDFSASSTIASMYGISTPPATTAMDLDTTEAVTSIAESSTSDDSTTVISTVDFTVSEEATTSMNDNSDITTVLDDSSTLRTNESPDITTEAIHLLTNATSVPEIFTHAKENTTDTGRSVDPSTTSIPDASGTPSDIAGNSSGVLIASTESPNLSVTSEDPRMVPSWKGPNFDGTTNAPSTEGTSEVEISSTPEEAIIIVTEGSTVGRAAVPSLVRIVFDGNWADVCPHLPALRQSLADLLTAGLEKTVLASQIIFQKNPCSDGYAASSTTDLSATSLLLYVVDQNGNPDSEMTKMLPALYSRSPIKLQVNIRSFQLVQDSDSGNAIAVVVVSCVAFICLVLLAGLLFIMRKRQTRFNYGERCRPVSLDAYSLDSVSAYNSVRRKGAARASKRSYGNPTFEDSSAIPSHPLNFAGLATFCNEQNIIAEEFSGIPQVTARIDELPPGAEVKNRYANVVPLPETRVSLMKINNDPLTEYINASYVRGPKNATKYYIACQAPIESTVTDFWRMIWEQQSKVIIMLTDLVENGVEKCAEYIPPSEVTDCHRLYGDFQVTLKKRETKEKYAISTLHLKNLENNTFREISHIWYLWPANGVQTDAAGLIAVLLEARALQRGGPGPIVVHCSPGTGRTGTLIALDLGIRQYEITRTVDVPRVVYTIRRDRAGSVQTKEQYAFIYKALNLYATKLAGGALES